MTRAPHPILLCVTLFIAALATLLASPARAEPPRVVADIAPIHSIVARVMQGIAVPDLLIPAGASPHSHALRPSDARALEAATLVVIVGHELTPWIERPLAALAPDAVQIKLIDLPGTILIETRDALDPEPDDDHDHDDDHAHDHEPEEAHDHGLIDPHLWLDPENARVWATELASALSTLDPGNAAQYRANAAAFGTEVDALLQDIAEITRSARDSRFLSLHDAFQYFEARFDLVSAGALALSDAVPPGPARLARIRDVAQNGGVACVFTEPQLSPGLAATIVEGTGLTLATLDPLGSSLTPGPDLYAQLLRDMARAIAGCAG